MKILKGHLKVLEILVLTLPDPHYDNYRKFYNTDYIIETLILKTLPD